MDIFISFQRLRIGILWLFIRRDKKAFLNEKYKEVEKNNWMGKTRNFFKKIENIKGTFYARMAGKRIGMIKTK